MKELDLRVKSENLYINRDITKESKRHKIAGKFFKEIDFFKIMIPKIKNQFKNLNKIKIQILNKITIKKKQNKQTI